MLQDTGHDLDFDYNHNPLPYVKSGVFKCNAGDWHMYITPEYKQKVRSLQIYLSVTPVNCSHMYIMSNNIHMPTVVFTTGRR